MNCNDARKKKKKRTMTQNVLQIPRITNTTIKYFVDDEFIDNVTVDEVNKIREKVLEYIIDTKDISILNRFYFIGHKDTNNGKMGEEVKMTMDNYGNLSDLPWEMAHVRRSMMHLMQIGNKHCELLNSLNNDTRRKRKRTITKCT